MRQHVIKDERLRAQLQKTQPKLVDAAFTDPEGFHRMVREIDDQKHEAEAKRLREEQALMSDPFNVEAQRRIEKAIQQENIMANMEAALEYNPESFGRVHMLYIDTEVNGYPVKAFVDSGAQATIMSPECAKKCG